MQILNIPTCTVSDIPFSDVTMAETVAIIMQMVQKGASPQHICTGNLDHLYLLERDAEFRNAYDTASLVLADGMPVVWLSRLNPTVGQAPLRERVTGSDLFWDLARASQATGLRLFFLGGKPGAADGAAEEVQRRYPGAQIVGQYCPPAETFATAEEQERIRDVVRAADPDVLLVGLGAPKQEKWIAANKALLGVPVSVGVGGTFEMASGQAKRAPRWMQRVGMEWAYRLAQDPARLYRRYLCHDLPYLLRAAAQIFGRSAPKSPAVTTGTRVAPAPTNTMSFSKSEG